MIKFETNGVEVRIYKTRASMRRAVRGIGYNCDHTESVVIPVIAAYSFKNGIETPLNLVAEMYLHKGISLPVLVHETLHAATCVLRKKKKKLNLSSKITYKEELLAYTQTAILQDVLKNFFPKRNSKYDFRSIHKLAVNSSRKKPIKL
jgi:hypothetical protein